MHKKISVPNNAVVIGAGLTGKNFEFAEQRVMIDIEFTAQKS